MYKKIKYWLDKSLESMTAITMGILVLDVLWQVVTRFIIKDPSSWTEELATFLLIWVGLLGSAVALNRGAHLGIDYFTAKLSEPYRIIVAAFVFLLIAVFSSTALLYGGIELVTETLDLGQTAPALGLKLGYVYLAVPIAGFFITLYSIEFLVHTIRKLLTLKASQ